jgi:hypothetical protein
MAVLIKLQGLLDTSSGPVKFGPDRSLMDKLLSAAPGHINPTLDMSVDSSIKNGVWVYKPARRCNSYHQS